MHRLKVLQFNDSSGRSVLCKTAEQLLEFLFNMEQEVWKDIPWYEWLYKASNLGRIKSLWNGGSNASVQKVLKPWRHKYWHSNVVLCKDWISKWLIVSRIIWITFIPNPDNKPFVLHKDETIIDWYLNNSVYNLWWGTHTDNMRDMIKKRRGTAKMVIQYDKNMKFIKKWGSMLDVERELWIWNQQISACCSFKPMRKSAWWFIWRYSS